MRHCPHGRRSNCRCQERPPIHVHGSLPFAREIYTRSETDYGVVVRILVARVSRLRRSPSRRSKRNRIRRAPALRNPAGSPTRSRAASELPRLHSLLASWRGEVVLERYFNGARAARRRERQVGIQEHHLGARWRRHRSRPRARSRDADTDVLSRNQPRTETTASSASRSRIS